MGLQDPFALRVAWIQTFVETNPMVITVRKPLELVENVDRNVDRRPSLEQPRDHGPAERPGATGDERLAPREIQHTAEHSRGMGGAHAGFSGTF